jgi:hypothetical protein
MLPQSSVLPISQPVKSAKYNICVNLASHAGNGNGPNAAAGSEESSTTTNQSQLHAKHDLVVWFEVLELGEMLPAS